jgi:hypothetical protein
MSQAFNAYATATPEAALRDSERFQAEENYTAALESLNAALQNRRNKSQNTMMEKLMVS